MLTQYQVGGSLHNKNPTYVVRSSDHQLYNALKAGEFCYVFNSRQMGKSSLLVRTKHQLEAEGYCCTVIDMTQIGIQDTTPLQWYKGIGLDLLRGFGCFGKFNFKAWWQEQEGISLVQKLSELFKILLIEQFPEQNLCIFIDEIDSLLSLNFPIDDFFALIRSCYNKRAVNPAYKRLTFALFGVATPSDLIADKTRTPFNIGTAIDLTGFTLEETAPLAQGLIGVFEQPEVILQEILIWTNGQPFLTQKLLKLLISNYHQKPDLIAESSPTLWIKKIVRSQIIEKWESQDEPEHLRTIRDRLIYNYKNAGRLLGIYQTLLQGLEIKTNDSLEHSELLLSGLIINHQGYLKVRNLIYQEVFNLEWVHQQLTQLRPYSQTFEAWIASASFDSTVKLWKRNQHLLKPLYDHKDTIGNLASSSDGQLFATVSEDNTLKLWHTDGRLWQTVEQPQSSFRAVVFSPDSRLMVTGSINYTVQLWDVSNRDQSPVKLLRTFKGHQGAIYGLAISPDGKMIASGGDDKTIKIWNLEGKLLHSINAHKERIWGLAFSADSQLLASASQDGTVKLWHADGTLAKTLTQQKSGCEGVAFNPQGNLIASTCQDRTLKLWKIDGILVKTIDTDSKDLTKIAFSPDGQIIAAGSLNHQVILWNVEGKLLKILPGHQGTAVAVAFTADGKFLISGSDDHTVILWDINKILHVNELEYACDWVRDYLRTNIEVEESDRLLCP
ncbi:putative WD repeat-containing protein slr0143 [Planktothrix tepida]|uniref:WD-40 repeat protein n=1 Tax=Planktothrix tepida PCC 9214 TaxID=671072 RepID=A0A1J1LIU4_9CYAN